MALDDQLIEPRGVADHRERNHQGVGNRLLTPAEPVVRPANGNAPVERRERLGGLLNFYYRRVA